LAQRVHLGPFHVPSLRWIPSQQVLPHCALEPPAQSPLLRRPAEREGTNARPRRPGTVMRQRWIPMPPSVAGCRHTGASITPRDAAMPQHPFADLIDLSVTEQAPGHSRCRLPIADKHLNPHRVVHGAVMFALADTGMGAALYPTLAAGELCATVEIKINYFKPVTAGELHCTTTMVNRGRTLAHLESSVYCGDTLVAKASGNYAIFTPRAGAA